MSEPTEADLQAEIARQLAALGVKAEPHADDRAFELLVAGWREAGKAPRPVDIARTMGIKPSSLANILGRLQAAGRVLYSGRGVWVPRVVE